LFLGLVVFFSIKNILFGGRIEVLQLLLLLFFIYLVIPKKIGLFTFFLFSIIILPLFSIIGFIRSNPTILLESDYIFSTFSNIEVFFLDVEYINSTQGDVIQSSARLLGIVERGELQYVDRLVGFPGFLISSIVPSSFLPQHLNLSTYLQDRYRSGGGGLAPVYFFVWLGYLGPFIVGIWVGRVINLLNESKSRFFKIYSLLVLITFPRWYSYNPIFFVKFCLYGAIIYSVTYFINKSDILKFKISESGL
jgi:hypothetical protein